MKLRKTLLCGVAATALGLAAALPTNSSILPSFATPAQAQVQASVSIGFGTFYDSLSPYGDWVRIEGRHVWVPGDVRADWRPYTVGRWAYTRPHGWTWVSDEPYGWAVYHYGRWGFHHRIGWYWVPDTQWAPAWVSWRASGDYAVWAPMPPQGLVGISYEVDPYAIPGRYWVAVPTSQFLAPNLFSVAIHFGEPRFYDVVRHTRPIGHVRVVNNIAVNTYINVNYIENETGESVRVYDVREASEPGEVRLGDDAIEIFAPAVEEEADAEPQQVRTEEEVAEERGVDMAGEPADEEADQPIEVAEDAPELPKEAVAEEAAPVTDEDVAEEPAEGEPEADVAEEPKPAPEADVAEEPAEGEPEADVAEEPQPAPEADVAEEPADGEPQADVAEEPKPAPQADVAEEPKPAPQADAAEEPKPAPQADVAEEPKPAPQADVAEEPKPAPQADVAEEPAPQVEERAIGEPAEPAAEPQLPPQPQQRGSDEDEEKEQPAQ
jgi:hypothetical protein